MKIHANYPLQKLNTFGLNVLTTNYCKVTSVEDIKELLAKPEISGQNKLILGGGSNMLFSKDYQGLIIHNCIEGIRIDSQGEDQVLVSAGGGSWIWRNRKSVAYPRLRWRSTDSEYWGLRCGNKGYFL